MKPTLRDRLDAILERTAAPTVRFGEGSADLRLLERPDAGREHDLPPLWDGRPVTWDQWEIETPTSLVFHLGPEAFACPMCGVVDAEPLRARGRALHLDVEVGHEVAAYLYATRCPHCAHDQVYAFDSDELFDLEASDYGDEGSS